MSEIVDDVKVNLIEAVSNLGITLTSDNTQINHTKKGVFNIESNGSVNIKSGDDADEGTGGSISITGGLGANNGKGGDINIDAGTGNTGDNVQGGDINIAGGNAKGTIHVGGSVSISAGQGGNSTKGGNVTISGGGSTGTENGGDIFLYGGGAGSGGGKFGRIQCQSLFRVAVYENDIARNDFQSPLIGDICFVITGTNPAGNNKLQVYTGSGWAICN